MRAVCESYVVPRPEPTRHNSPKESAEPGNSRGRIQASRTYLAPAIQGFLARRRAAHLVPLLNLIASRASGSDTCRASQAELARELVVSIVTVKRGEAALVRLELLEVRRGLSGNRRELAPTWFRALSTESGEPVENSARVVSPGAAGGIAGDTTHSPPAVKAFLQRSRGPTCAQTHNLGVLPSPVLAGAPPRSRPRHEVVAVRVHVEGGMWRNTLAEVLDVARLLAGAWGEEEAERDLIALLDHSARFPGARRGACLLGALRKRASKVRREAPGLFDRPLAVLV